MYKVKHLAFGRSVVEIGEEAFKTMYRCYGPLVLPDSVEIIGDSAFANWSSFNYLRLGDNIKYIGNYTFNDCFGFKSILRITTSLETLGNYSFNKCTQMVDKIVIPNNVYFIGEYAFYNCHKVNETGEYSFAFCYNIYDFKGLPSSLVIIGNNTFERCSFSVDLTIPSSVTLISNYAFRQCKSIRSLKFEQNSQLEEIGSEAFRDCYYLSGSLSLPHSLSLLGSYAFHY